MIRTETETVDGEPVNAQFVTEFFRGVHADVSRGERPPGHRLDETAKASARLTEIRYPIADDQTTRYAAASGDFFEIHLDDEAARAVGLPGRIVHGLCTMAFTGRAVLEAAGVDDPSAIARLAVRFSAPLRPGRHNHDTDLGTGRPTRLWLRGARLRRTAGDQGRARGARA